MKLLSTALIGLLLFSMTAQAGVVLTKSLYELDDFYYACTAANQHSTQQPPANRIGDYRPTIQFDTERDTVWVKVFISTDSGSDVIARAEFRKLNLRGVSQFGDIFAAKVAVLDLPRLEELPFVRSIEPVAPSGILARASRSADPPLLSEPASKKK